MILKYLFFIFHIFFILLNFIIIYWQIAIINVIVMISWKLNRNKCMLTQIEDYLFNQTLIEIIFGKIIKDESKYIVPSSHRYSLFFIFIFNLSYNLVTYYIERC
jgi:hypothetical protein